MDYEDTLRIVKSIRKRQNTFDRQNYIVPLLSFEKILVVWMDYEDTLQIVKSIRKQQNTFAWQIVPLLCFFSIEKILVV